MLLPTLAFFNNTNDGVLISLFIIFAVAKLFAEIFERLNQPAVVGEILAGVIIGPSVLGWVKQTELTHALSELGVMLLLFTVGLEMRTSALLKVGKKALFVAISGVVFPLVLGTLLMKGLKANNVESFFIGAAMVATSVGITARVLATLNKLHTEVSRIILAAAVIDDILGLIVLSAVSSLAKGSVNYYELSLVVCLSVGFTLFMIFAGTKIAKRTKPQVDKLQIGHAYFIFALLLCLGMSLLATFAGVAGIIGAFLAGLALSEVSEGTDLQQQAGAVMEFLVPFFFVGIGLQLQLASLNNRYTLLVMLLVTVLAIITKLVGCGLPALSLGRMNALKVGIGMVPRGEVGIIVAQIGRNMNVLSDAIYGVVVFMSLATTIIAPALLKLIFRYADQAEAADSLPPNQPKEQFVELG